MRPLKAGLCFVFAMCASAVLSAGQIYGTIVMDGQPLKDTDIEIKCGEEGPAKGKTAADGAYRINVPQQGQCSLTLPSDCMISKMSIKGRGGCIKPCSFRRTLRTLIPASPNDSRILACPP